MQTDPHTSAADDAPCFGFYCVVELESIGFAGGYLVLNQSGRPIEFHCTFPIKPDRSQEILYGYSLKPFLYSQHIGPPLIRKARTPVSMVLVNQADSRPLGRHIDLPVAWIDESGERESGEGRSLPTASGEISAAGSATCLVDAVCVENAARIEHCRRQAPGLDWGEPFERIVTALTEAHTVTRQHAS
jgi:hypothetical protein